MSDGSLDGGDFSGDPRISAPRLGPSLSESAAGALPARRSRLGLVPADYAEKTMNALLSLHEGLMSEKERALELTRSLDAARQEQAELQAYVRLLEVELARSGGLALGAAREDGSTSLKQSVEALLRVLAMPSTDRLPPSAGVSSPRGDAPAVPSPAGPPAAQPGSDRAEQPAMPVETSLAPRPPRPSAAYRAPAGPRVEPTGLDPSAVSPTDPSPDDRVAWRQRGVADEGWRQW